MPLPHEQILRLLFAFLRQSFNILTFFKILWRWSRTSRFPKLIVWRIWMFWNWDCTSATTWSTSYSSSLSSVVQAKQQDIIKLMYAYKIMKNETLERNKKKCAKRNLSLSDSDIYPRVHLSWLGRCSYFWQWIVFLLLVFQIPLMSKNKYKCEQSWPGKGADMMVW